MQKTIIKRSHRPLSYLIASGFALGGLAACSLDVVSSQDVKPEAIYQDYNASFNEDTQNTWFWGTFRVGGSTGTTVALDGRSSLVINGAPAHSSAILGQHYELVVGQGYVPNITTVWTDPNGAVYTNILLIKPVSYVQAPVSPTPIANSYTVYVSASGLDATESVSGRITTQDSSLIVLSDSYNANTGALTFNASTMMTLKPGLANLTVIRSKSSGLTNVTNTGGFASTSYSVRTVTITLQ